MVDELNEIKNSMRTYHHELEKRNIEVVIPQTDHVAFTESIHTEDLGIFHQTLERMIEGDKVKAMLKNQ